MTCAEFESQLHPYVDGELAIGDTAAADAHLIGCPACSDLARGERDFRALLRCQPRERAPEELRRALRARLRRQAWRSAARPWLLAPTLAAAVLAMALLPGSRTQPPLIVDLVDQHIAYAQLDRPAEHLATDPAEVSAWFLQRAGLRVTVPDFSPAGIRLVGGRLAAAQERRVAYLLYEKGSVLLSVFVVAAGPEAGRRPRGDEVTFRGSRYVQREHKGFRTVSWVDGTSLFGLVSSLDYQALLECADRLRDERARQTRL